MGLMDMFLRRTEFAVLPLQTADLHSAAAIHAEGFSPAWTDGDIERLLARDATFGLGARPVGKKGLGGFILYTLAAGEAEILTIATAQSWRRRGIGEMLIKAALSHLNAERAEAMFLEVGEANHAALALYRKLGFAQVGTRRDYYGKGAAVGASALVMRRDLR
jgi:[ribosomal protein S18]-alanine N-acetyltransferase